MNSFKLTPCNISFKSNPKKVPAFSGEKPAANPLEIPDQYLSSESKNKTVTICGLSRNADSIKEYTTKTHDTAKELVNRGYNVLTGCGDKGIMGAAYMGASSAEKDKENPEHNLALLVNPLWGDEDTKHCKVIGKPASSEVDRTQNGFLNVSKNLLIFPGGAYSIVEAAIAIANNKYRPKNTPPLNIFLVGKDYYQGLVKQYDDMDKKHDTLGEKRENLFKVIEPEDVLKEFPDLKRSERKLEITA